MSYRSPAEKSLIDQALLFLGLCCLLGLKVPTIKAQANADPLEAIGVPPFSTQLPAENGYINPANGNVHIEIPLGSFAQRGGVQMKAALTYDSAIWSQNLDPHNWDPYSGTINSQYDYCGGTSTDWCLSGWRYMTTADNGTDNSNFHTRVRCSYQGSYEDGVVDYSAWSWTDPNGATHFFPIKTTEGFWTNCADYSNSSLYPQYNIPNGDHLATDASGYHMYVTGFTNAAVYAPDGTLVHFTFGSQVPKDTNGNYFVPGSKFNITDTLGRTPVIGTINGNTVYFDVLNTTGGRSRYTVNLEQISVSTNFKAYGSTLGEYSSSAVTVIHSIQLPDGTSYSFGYDSGTMAGHYGEMTSMTLPTGSTIQYQYQNFADSEYAVTGKHITREICKRITPDGSWTYTPSVIAYCTTISAVNCQQKLQVSPQSGDVSVYTFNINAGIFPTQIDFYTGASTWLASQSKIYDYSAGAYVTPLSETTTLPIPTGNISRKTQYVWDPTHNGNMNQKSEWNFYSGTPSANPDRTTCFTYASPGTHIVSRPSNVTVVNNWSGTPCVSIPSAAIVAETTYSYDGAPLVTGVVGACPAVTGATNHDPNYGTTYTARGNLTQVQRYTSASNYLPNSPTYDITGQKRSSTDARGYSTNYCYADSFVNGSPPSPTNAYATSITNALGQSRLNKYYYAPGLLQSTTDPNIQTTSLIYDGMGRLTATTFPDGGQTGTSYNYNGAVLSGSTTTKTITSSTNLAITNNLDGLGRDSGDVLGSGATIATQYDSNGRTLKVSNPYLSTSDSTYGWTIYAYDGLNRKVQITKQDGSLAYTYFGALVTNGGGRSSQLCSGVLGYPILTVDEASKKRQTWVDGFGRLIEVDEADSSNTLTVGTCYGYDLNNNLTSVVQSGSHSRIFAYDFLSRLISAQNPESGTITYSYDSNGNLATKIAPQANQTGTATTTTTYCYDALNRLTGKKYAAASCPLSSPDVSYSYDGTGCPTGKTCFNLGHRTGLSDAAGSESWSYYYISGTGDGVTDQRTTSNVSKSIVHAYNYDHTPASITYPSGHTITYGINSAERLTSVIDNTNSSNPINYATGGLYTPPGTLASIFYGPSNILATWIYNPRLRPCRIAANTSGTAPSSCGDPHTGNVFDLAYNFSLGSDNGNVASVTNNLDPTRSQAFSYDPLNRLLTAQTTGTYANSPSRCWGESYQYDNQTSGGAWGNLTGITGISSYNGCTQESLSILVGGNNQITTSGFGYDAAGNLIASPPTGTTYSYNAENQLAQASGFVTAGYLYDGDGKRVAKTSAGTAYKLYWYGMNDAPLAESDGSGNITDEYIFFNGKRIARRVAH